LRYKYIDFKYTRRVYPDASFQSMWESMGSWPMQSTNVWRPSTDIYETPDDVIVIVELAGVAEENMTVTLFSDLLVVEGTREQSAVDMYACHQLGIKYGEFRSEVNLHARVDHDNVKAEYKNGLLIIILKKTD